MAAKPKADQKAAEKEARAALAAAPNDARAWLRLGRALRGQGRDDEAAEAERKSIEAATHDPRHRAAAASLRAGKAVEANSQLQQLVEEDGDDVLALMLFGSQASKGRQYALADRLLVMRDRKGCGEYARGELDDSSVLQVIAGEAA